MSGNLRLHQIHSLVFTRGQAYPIRDGGDAHLSQNDFHHRTDHGCNISNSESLSNDYVWDKSIHIAHEFE
jgi:hypothetical protein